MEKGERTDPSFKGVERMRQRKEGRLYRIRLPTGPFKVSHFYLSQLPRREN